LKVSFLRTLVCDFLRAGNFVNVETLVLNSGPFPEVLEAVTQNESFRSLRYIQFGNDREGWITSYPIALRFNTLAGKIRTANERNVPHGEMREVLRGILRNTPLVPAAPPATKRPTPTFGPAPLRRAMLTPEGELKSSWSWVVGVFCLAIICTIGILLAAWKQKHPSLPNLDYKPNEFKVLSAEEIEKLKKQKSITVPTKPATPATKPDKD
jgi:hypothetical protein